MQTIEEAIHTFIYKQNRETTIDVFEAVRHAMNQKKPFFVPVQFLDENKEEFSFGMMKDGKGQKFIVAFSNEKDFEKMEAPEKMKVDIEVFLSRILNMDDISGVVINPVGETFVLGKPYISMIFEANAKEKA